MAKNVEGGGTPLETSGYLSDICCSVSRAAVCVQHRATEEVSICILGKGRTGWTICFCPRKNTQPGFDAAFMCLQASSPTLPSSWISISVLLLLEECTAILPSPSSSSRVFICLPLICAAVCASKVLKRFAIFACFLQIPSSTSNRGKRKG